MLIKRPHQQQQQLLPPLDDSMFSQRQGADISTLDAFGQALHARIVRLGGSVRAATVLNSALHSVRLPPMPANVSLKAYILENALHFYWNEITCGSEHIQVMMPPTATESSANDGAGSPGLGMEDNDDGNDDDGNDNDNDNDDAEVLANKSAAAATVAAGLPAAAVAMSSSEVDVGETPTFVLPEPLSETLTDAVLAGSCSSTPAENSIGFSFDNLSASTALLGQQPAEAVNGGGGVPRKIPDGEKAASTEADVYYKTVVQTIMESGLGNAVESALLSANPAGVKTATLVTIIMPVRRNTHYYTNPTGIYFTRWP